MICFLVAFKVGWENNAIKYLVFTYNHMYLLLAFLMATFIGGIILYDHTSPTRYVFIIINLLSTQQIYRGKCYINFAYVQFA